MPKALTILGASVGLLVLVIFGLDLVSGFLSGGTQKTMDIFFVICALLLAYLSWDTFRELH